MLESPRSWRLAPCLVLATMRPPGGPPPRQGFRSRQFFDGVMRGYEKDG